jgi:hypothetical protein
MDATTGLATEEPGIETAALPARLAWGFRLRLGTMLLLVMAAAPALAIYAKLSEDNLGPDEPTVMLLAIVLTGIAVGAWRRASPGQVIAQIGLTCAALLSLMQYSDTRLANYWLALVFAVAIVLPLLARAPARAAHDSPPGSRPRAWVCAVLPNVALNLLALTMFFSLNSLIVNGRIEISILQGFSNTTAVVVPGPFPAAPAVPTPLYAPPVPIAPGPMTSPYTLEPVSPSVDESASGAPPIAAPAAGPTPPALPQTDNKESPKEHP